MTELAFTVLGRPQPAGSKRAFPVRRGGRVTGVAVSEDNVRAKPWQALVAAAAVDALGEERKLAGPLVLEVDFYFARPAGHYGKGRNAGTVRAAAPRYPATRPDTTKLLRGLEDALNGLVWRDDSQIVDQRARKLYGDPERAEVLLTTVDASLQGIDDRLGQISQPRPLYGEARDLFAEERER